MYNNGGKTGDWRHENKLHGKQYLKGILRK
jgi:hypothetical protein